MKADTRFRSDFGYDCYYYPTIVSGPVFRWKLPDYNFEVSASREGVMLHGTSPILCRVDELRGLLRLAHHVSVQLSIRTEPDKIDFDAGPQNQGREKIYPGGW